MTQTLQVIGSLSSDAVRDGDRAGTSAIRPSARCLGQLCPGPATGPLLAETGAEVAYVRCYGRSRRRPVLWGL
jgi:hypothetical protein